MLRRYRHVPQRFQQLPAGRLSPVPCAELRLRVDGWRFDDLRRGYRLDNLLSGSRFNTYLLRQLARLAARHGLHAFFLLAILYDRFFTSLRFSFLLNLTLLVVTTAIAFTARRLIVASFAFIAIFCRCLADVARFDVLLLLAAVTTVFFARFTNFAILGTIVAVVTIIAAVVAIAAVVGARFATFLLALGFLLRFFLNPGLQPA